MPLVSAYQIVGDCVKYENQHGLLQVCPHTSNEFQHQEQFFNITNKHDIEIPLNISAEFPAGIQPKVFLREQGEWVEKFTYSGTIVFQPLQSRYFKLLYDVPINSTGKFNISMSYEEYEAKIDPWWGSSWNYRKPLNITETYGYTRYQEPFTINVTGLILNTGNCRQELRITAEYSTETDIPFSVINNSGQAVGVGNAWCVVQFLVNTTTANNATYTQKNVTNYYFYYGNSIAPNVTVVRLYGWNINFEGMNAPINDGWTAKGSIAGVSNYTYNTSGNSIWNANATGIGGYALWYKAVVPNNNGWTYEVRVKHLSDSGQQYISSGYGISRAGGNDAVIRIQSGSVNVGDLNDAPMYNNYTMATKDAFHVYRLTFIDASNTYKLYVDGVLRTSGTNGSAAEASSQINIGENWYTGTYSWNADTDYMFAALNGVYPPLSGVFSGEQANTAANLLLNGTDGNRNYLSSDTLNVTGSCIGVSGTLTRNGTPIANPYYASLAGGTYNFTITCTGNLTYATTSEQHDANVTQVVTPTPSPTPSPYPTAVVVGVVVETADGYALSIPLLKKECDCYGLNIPFVNWCLWGWVCVND